MAGLVPAIHVFVSQYVGWVERSDTHHVPNNGDGFREELNPSYASADFPDGAHHAARMRDVTIHVVPDKPTGRRKAPPDDRLRAIRDPHSAAAFPVAIPAKAGIQYSPPSNT
jgi:hypothetical protein